MRHKTIQVGSSIIKIAVQNGTNSGFEPQFWASPGEYPVYDGLAYDMMTNDQARSGRYLSAVNKFTPGKIVLDIGTGADINWARTSVDAGARKVYAIEEIPETYEKARAKIIALGLQDKICLLQGNSLEIELPEKVDVCVSEIIGTIGSSEGVCPALADAQIRFMKPDAIMIPQRRLTLVSAAMLPDQLYHSPGFGTEPNPFAGLIPMKTVEDVLQSVGHPFDLRLCITNFPNSNLLSTIGVMEDLYFEEKIQVDYEFETSMLMQRSGRVDGLLLWLNLWPDIAGQSINSLTEFTSWAPVYFPAFNSGVSVKPGDEITLRCKTVISDDGKHPDYYLSGQLKVDGQETDWSFNSTHHGATFRGNPLYASLFHQA